MSILDRVVGESGLPDVSNWGINYSANYTGRSCTKVGLVNLVGKKYMVKIEDNIKDKIPNAGLSYSNTPITEHLGCKIFEAFGINVQETFLCRYKGKNSSSLQRFYNCRKTYS